jgi:hypothetical protein
MTMAFDLPSEWQDPVENLLCAGDRASWVPRVYGNPIVGRGPDGLLRLALGDEEGRIIGSIYLGEHPTPEWIRWGWLRICAEAWLHKQSDGRAIRPDGPVP